MDWQDEEFEAFLRQFRPLEPKALPSRRRTIVAFAVAAAILVAVVIPMRTWLRGHPPAGTSQVKSADVPVTAVVAGTPHVDVKLAEYRPANASGRQMNVSLPASPLRKVLSAPTPQYPAGARRVELGGIVELRLTVGPAGDVTATERVRNRIDLRPGYARASERAEYYAANPDAFVIEAEKAVKLWKFEPAGSSTTVVASFTFTLNASTDTDSNPPAVSSSPTLSPLPRLLRSGASLPDAAVSARPRAGNRRLRAGADVTAPVRLVDVPPVYPEEARAAAIQGVVLLRIVISEEGLVIDAQVVRSVPELDQAAIDAVMQWQYEPTLLNGEPVEIEMVVTLNFTLR